MNTGRNILSEKLDQIGKSELGIELDESLLWDQLNNRLTKKKSVVWRRILVAASLVALMFIVPTIVSKDTSTAELAEIKSEIEKVNKPMTQSETEPVLEIVSDEAMKISKPSIIKLRRKGLDEINLLMYPPSEIVLNSISVKNKQPIVLKKSFFKSTDIAIIQASLQNPPISPKRKLPIETGILGSSGTTEIDYKELKIRLYVKN